MSAITIAVAVTIFGPPLKSVEPIDEMIFYNKYNKNEGGQSEYINEVPATDDLKLNRMNPYNIIHRNFFLSYQSNVSVVISYDGWCE